MSDDKTAFAERHKKAREKIFSSFAYKAQSRKRLWQIAAILYAGLPLGIIALRNL